jgi:ketosteroid isomerase-like protein
MSREHVETVRRVFEGWGRGDFSVSRELLAPHVVCVWDEPPSVIVCHGIDEMAARFKDFLAQWLLFRVEADEFVELHDGRILVLARQYATGRESGAETVSQVFIVWAFAGNEVVRMDWRFDRANAIEGAGAVG